MRLVQIFLRGGCDFLNFIPPIDGPDRKNYEEARPNLKVPISGPNQALPISKTLGFHPAAKPLHEFYQKKELAVIQATGLTRPTRSHFDAQAFVESGAADNHGPRTGWLTRLMQSHGDGGKVMSAVALGSQLPESFRSSTKAVVLNGLGAFNIEGGQFFEDMQRAALRRIYSGHANPLFCETATQTLNVIDEMEVFRDGNYQPAPGVEYPKADIGNRLKQLAQLLKRGIDPRFVTIDMGGWDTHKYQGNNGEGSFANMVGQLSQALQALYRELGGWDKEQLRVIVLTEFGRRLKENANGGTDHGHGSFMLALGHGIHGGKVYGEWPGLSNEELFERADLNVTTDYRQVLHELAGDPHVFPDFTPKATKLGLV